MDWAKGQKRNLHPRGPLRHLEPHSNRAYWLAIERVENPPWRPRSKPKWRTATASG